MKIVFLGTNGWYDTETGSTVCTLIETDDYFIILDAGNGFYKLDEYITSTDKKPIYLFLSHFHFDHIIGLHILNKFNFSQGIDVYGPPGTRKCFTTIVNPPYTLPIKQLKTEIRVNEIDKKSEVPVNVEFKKLKHSSLCYGFRFILENKVISYCLDTGICENLLHLAKNADLLITECSYKSDMKDKNWSHLNPEDAAQTARNSGAKKLALVHFDASLYRTFADRKQAEKMAKKIFKNTIVAQDDLSIEL